MARADTIDSIDLAAGNRVRQRLNEQALERASNVGLRAACSHSMAALSQQAVDIHGVCNRRILLQVLLSVLPYVRFQLLRLALPLFGAEKVGVSAHSIEKFGMLGS